MESIGADLFLLVQHLYRKSGNANDALVELSLRTREKSEKADVMMAPTAKEIAYTRWFGAVKNRFKLLREELLATREECKEAEEVMLSLYGNGCSVANLADAFSSAASLVSFPLKDQLVQEAASQRVTALSSKNIKQLSAKDLVKEFLTGPVLSSLIPERWWETQSDAAKRGIVTLRAVGMRLRPTRLVLEYTRSDTDSTHRVRHRTIQLDATFTATCPVTPFAKKLVATHGALLSESDLQRYLMRLQRVIKDDEINQKNALANPKLNDSYESDFGDDNDEKNHYGVKSSQQQAKPVAPAAGGGNKADLGLLYRDPEAALNDVDLQDADDLTVKEFKAKMSEKFDANVVKPGDPGYQYDKRVTVPKATKKSDWDDDESDEGSDDF